VIIKNVDTSVTQEEMNEILERQELPFKSAKRIISRERNAPTKMIRVILKTEDQKKKLLKEGINLDQMHFRCVPALEDTKLKCVLCAGAHRKSDCLKTKEHCNCANCSKNHAANVNANVNV
jgi:hypothetical protein